MLALAEIFPLAPIFMVLSSYFGGVQYHTPYPNLTLES
jgi:hypothetical protein